MPITFSPGPVFVKAGPAGLSGDAAAEVRRASSAITIKGGRRHRTILTYSPDEVKKIPPSATASPVILSQREE